MYCNVYCCLPYLSTVVQYSWQELCFILTGIFWFPVSSVWLRDFTRASKCNYFVCIILTNRFEDRIIIEEKLYYNVCTCLCMHVPIVLFLYAIVTAYIVIICMCAVYEGTCMCKLHWFLASTLHLCLIVRHFLQPSSQTVRVRLPWCSKVFIYRPALLYL